MIVSLVLLSVYVAILLIKHGLARSILRRDAKELERPMDESLASQVVIVQPILTGDPNLPSVLRRQLESLPRAVQYVWLIDETDAEGQRLGVELAREFPQASVESCPPCKADENPKTFKLARALELVNRRWFVVLDDDTEIDAQTLGAAIEALNHTQLYTGLPVYRVPSGWWGSLVAHFVNSQSILTYLPPLAFFQPMSLNGMFYLVEAEALKSIGGFDPIRHELCDDYALHRHVVAHGWKVTQGVRFQRVSTSVDSFGEYWRLMNRWMVFGLLLARDQPVPRRLYLVTMLALPPVLLLIALPFAAFHVGSLVALVFVLLIRHLLLVRLHRFANMPRERFGFFASVLSELLQPLQIVAAVFKRSIEWRGRRIRLRDGLRFETTGSRR